MKKDPRRKKPKDEEESKSEFKELHSGLIDLKDRVDYQIRL